MIVWLAWLAVAYALIGLAIFVVMLRRTPPKGDGDTAAAALCGLLLLVGWPPILLVEALRWLAARHANSGR